MGDISSSGHKDKRLYQSWATTQLNFHLKTTVDMLPVFACAGDSQYAKGGHLYLEMMDRHSILNKPV